MISENSKMVIDYLKSVHGAQEVTAADVAEAIGLPKKTVDCCFTASLQKKGYGVRIPAEVELADGTHKQVKLLTLTDEGMAYDYNAPVESK